MDAIDSVVALADEQHKFMSWTRIAAIFSNYG